MRSVKSPVLQCRGCQAVIDPRQPYPFSCPNARPGDGIDHVVGRHTLGRPETEIAFLPNENPFISFRRLFTSHTLGLAGGITDGEYCEIVQALDTEVAQLNGTGFVPTPLLLQPNLGSAVVGGNTLWVKDETGNVSGSHKARHLMGIQIYLQTLNRLERGKLPDAKLAIASCGNAALAAAFVARAAKRSLDVYVPPEVDKKVEATLLKLGATLHRCRRREGEAGDPCYLRFKKAIGAGALPFGCQGSDNGLTIEGGETLAYELAWQLKAEKATLDRLLVQVGGGALASACIQGLKRAQALGILERLPRIHTVQTEGASPMHRAYDRFVQHVEDRGLATFTGCNANGRVETLQQLSRAGALAEALQYAAQHRRNFMWPWEDEPQSLAHGILDDETYDWLALLEGMVDTGGYPITVREELIVRANEVARQQTAINVDPTGSSGLAGLLQLQDSLEPAAGETIGLIFSGVTR